MKNDILDVVINFSQAVILKERFWLTFQITLQSNQDMVIDLFWAPLACYQ